MGARPPPVSSDHTPLSSGGHGETPRRETNHLLYNSRRIQVPTKPARDWRCEAWSDVEWHVNVEQKHGHRHRHMHSRRDGCSRVEVEAAGGPALAGRTVETNRVRAMPLVLVQAVRSRMSTLTMLVVQMPAVGSQRRWKARATQSGGLGGGRWKRRKEEIVEEQQDSSRPGPRTIEQSQQPPKDG